jgi:hypothetical protein
MGGLPSRITFSTPGIFRMAFAKVASFCGGADQSQRLSTLSVLNPLSAWFIKAICFPMTIAPVIKAALATTCHLPFQTKDRNIAGQHPGRIETGQERGHYRQRDQEPQRQDTQRMKMNALWNIVAKESHNRSDEQDRYYD